MSMGLKQKRRESAGQAGANRFGMHDSTGLQRMIVISYSALMIFFNFM